MKLKLAIISMVLLIMAGCNQQQKSPDESFVATTDAFTATVKILTIAQRQHAFSDEAKRNITLAIHSGQACLEQLYLDPNDAGAANCVASAMITLIEEKKKAGK